jgi:hypothetical protein
MNARKNSSCTSELRMKFSLFFLKIIIRTVFSNDLMNNKQIRFESPTIIFENDKLINMFSQLIILLLISYNL